MKAASNLIMWLAMVLLVSLAMVLGLVLLLLAELYCSPLISRCCCHHHLQPTTTTGNDSDGHSQSHSDASPSPLHSLTTPTDTSDDIEKQLHQPPENQDSGRTQHQDKSGQGKVATGKRCSGDSVNGCSIVYISNPIFDDENGRGSTVAGDDDDDDKTPFETPDTSPSRLETEDSSGDEEISSSRTPLTPMKKLPAGACTVAQKDGGRLMGAWGSDTNSKNDVSSSSSSTPSTSPSL
ncbi:putative protein TPRXL [Cynara cardunculus var. scolymus]|uniref:putative protein TPRXL n=1 Tax=Cynara cardunculus var. scolymus TaxID=59895 RepID=UPI000D6281FA|nr:putative protein TPRXL [Cynara cardunculus var. scolymus]